MQLRRFSFGARTVVTFPRGGATLTEILMALLIMSIGIVPLFTLFPISLLQSIRGSQLTNAAILEENVRAMVKTVPSLINPPVGDPWDGTSIFKGEWTPNTDYVVGNVVIPPRQRGELLPQPFIVLRCTTAGRSLPMEPAWKESDTTREGPDTTYLTWTPFTRSANPALYNYVVDPIGARVLPNSFDDFFGNDGTNPLTLRRQSSQNSFIPDLVPSPFELTDSWTELFRTQPLSVVDTTVTLPAGVDMTGMIPNTYNGSPDIRVILRKTTDNSILILYPGTGTAGTTIELVDIYGDPAAAGTNVMEGELSVETRDRRYSCLLAVRNRGLSVQPQVTCVTFFSRNVSLASEHAYEANFGNIDHTGVPGIQGDGNMTTDQVRLTWTVGTDPDPLLKEGNYIFDANNVIFYKITNVSTGSGAASLTLSTPIQPSDQTTSGVAGRAILMPGIIDVFTF